MLNYLKKLFKTTEPIKKDVLIEEPDKGVYLTKLEVSALYDAKKNEYIQYDTLHIEGNPDRLGLLLRGIADREGAVNHIIQIAARNKKPTVHMEVFHNEEAMARPVGSKNSTPTGEMSDDEIRKMIIDNNKDIMGDD